MAFDNAFQIATYGNGSVDENWPACLACAAIKGSLRRLDIDLPEQCDECFKRHCWNGSTSSRRATEADFDLGLRLDPGLSFGKWNESDWSKEDVGGSEGGDDSAGSRVGNHLIGLVISIVAIVYLL
jgi:lysophospholipase